jgi:hypothetical protein
MNWLRLPVSAASEKNESRSGNLAASFSSYPSKPISCAKGPLEMVIVDHAEKAPVEN